MSDRIELRGVRARGTHGVFEHEKRDGQEFVVDVVIEADLGPAGRTDDLTRTINYGEVAAGIVARIEGESLDLIESLAAQIAGDILKHPRVESVEVTVHKPQAPVGVPFGDVAVVVDRQRPIVPIVVALGSNLGSAVDGEVLSPAETVQWAAEGLLELSPTVRLSNLVATDPVGGPEQPEFVNAIALLTTQASPYEVLRELHAMEARFGRTRDERWGPRTLDLDLVQYGDPHAGTDVVLDDADLTLPHPRAHERGFVLVPWATVDPTAVLRVDGVTRAVAELAEQVDTSGVRAIPATDGGWTYGAEPPWAGHDWDDEEP
ncbi:2-amino-4-hydroxy-6-hydroxymethyldihydropteridine diphosphokinase [Kribbia dieselivorans]|uniref:2-amino-4-hydroxy-6- hydroxymethyldihydropteridine diphosphokinase n=1 Tax=Kribbia dieselivorans TaxID=331526 RepID=UPI000837E8FF|nr:2-amino-4-hydroxy-6-hydroxymethyldihydropteridine diphosphokinase [Kribbia dieselivorans]